MALYQTSVLKNYLKRQDKETVAKAFKKFSKYFHNTSIQQNIRESKEEQFQEGFLRELFVDILGYTLNPHPNYNLTTELKNEKGAKKADGAILLDGNALGVIELKSTKTKDLENIRLQAFDYKANQTGCVYVITSNFEKLRFYINNAVEFEEFDLFTLTESRFELLYLCLHKDNLLSNVPLKIKEASVREEEVITKQFYNDYSLFKRELFRDLVKLNMKNEVFRQELSLQDAERANKNIKHALFKKSQKLIDRFLFIFFAEDRDLLPPNSTLKILEQWNKLKDLDAYAPLYERFKLYFGYLDTGRKGTDKGAEIFAYNGGLFKPDTILDSLLISDELLFKHTQTLSKYDFESQVDVNILGHIFENSLNEIESVNAEIEGVEFDKQKTKRKKDGVFYTPKYITKYIVDNTVGKLCEEKKAELNIVDEEYTKNRKGRTTAKLKELKDQLDNYRNWLLQLTICDPACGSGAFLNQALDFLIKEHQYIDELQTSLLGGGFVFPDIENTVLENNIFGVDLNEESVEIAKLSLWLRTAQPRRKLNDLSSNIKCGNSLIDSKAVAGDKAFKWEEEFPQIFEKESKQLYLVTFVTHNSRISDRMVEFNPPEFIKGLQPFTFDGDDYIKMIDLIAEGIRKYEIPTVSFTVIPDHVHLLCAAKTETDLNEQIRKLKGFTSFEFQRYKNWEKGENKVWAQKFNRKLVVADRNQVGNVVDYINKNVPKHSERWGQTIIDKGLKPLAELNNNICLPFETAIENKGGFDVVIGNPPYVRAELIIEYKNWFEKKYKSFHGNADLYIYFYELGINLTKKNGYLSYIAPNKWVQSKYGESLRRLIGNNYSLEVFIDFGEAKIFEGVGTFPSISIIRNNNNKKDFEYSELTQIFSIKNMDLSLIPKILINKATLLKSEWVLKNSSISNLLNKLENNHKSLGNIFKNQFLAGIKTGSNKHFIYSKKEVEKITNSVDKEMCLFKPIFFGKHIEKYSIIDSEQFVFFPYKYKDGKQEKIVLEEYENTYRYYLELKDELIKRAIIKEGVVKGTHVWYELQQVNKVIDYKKYKIVYPDIAKENRFSIDRSGSIPDMTCFFIPIEDTSYLPVFNSKLFKFLASNYCPILGNINEGGRIRYKSNYLAKIPFPKIEQHKNELENSSSNRERVYTAFNESCDKLIKYLKSQFKIEKLTTKLQNWHELTFGEFIQELNKAIKTVGGTPLTKLQEMEWMEVFETKKAEAQTLKAEIEKTDKEIDKMVYELYGLSEEEIKIVEGN